jgi:hypothetical protein
MPSKYPSIGRADTLAIVALRTAGIVITSGFGSEDSRRIGHAIECDFTSTSSQGSWSSRNCSEAAEFIEAYERDGVLVPSSNQYSRLRCLRHKVIDERTAANRGWGGHQYLPFDAQAVAIEKATELANRKRAEKDDASYRAAQVAAKVLLDTIALDPATKAVLADLANEDKLFAFDLINPRSK